MKGKKQSYKDKVARLRENAGERGKTFKNFCQHIELGYSKDCFGELSVHHLEEMFQKYPLEFDVEEYKLAKQKGKAYWESLGRRQADGTCLGNSRTWFYNMSMRYGWSDKIEVKAEHKGALAINIVNYGSPVPSEPIVEDKRTLL